MIGGHYLESHERVSKYTLAGWQEDFPSLTTGRKEHGCSEYKDSAGRQVRLENVELSLSLLSGLPRGWRREQAR